MARYVSSEWSMSRKVTELSAIHRVRRLPSATAGDVVALGPWSPARAGQGPWLPRGPGTIIADEKAGGPRDGKDYPRSAAPSRPRSVPDHHGGSRAVST